VWLNDRCCEVELEAERAQTSSKICVYGEDGYVTEGFPYGVGPIASTLERRTHVVTSNLVSWDLAEFGQG
jgi:hypothetical protein